MKILEQNFENEYNAFQNGILKHPYNKYVSERIFKNHMKYVEKELSGM